MFLQGHPHGLPLRPFPEVHVSHGYIEQGDEDLEPTCQSAYLLYHRKDVCDQTGDFTLLCSGFLNHKMRILILPIPYLVIFGLEMVQVSKHFWMFES